MDFLCVNVLVYAHREDMPQHAEYERYLNSLFAGSDLFCVGTTVLASFLRIVTNPKAFAVPTPADIAYEAALRIANSSNCLLATPGPKHWNLFMNLCRVANARGNLVPDAYLAAMAIELDATLVTADRGFARWPGLKWRHPLD